MDERAQHCARTRSIAESAPGCPTAHLATFALMGCAASTSASTAGAERASTARASHDSSSRRTTIFNRWRQSVNGTDDGNTLWEEVKLGTDRMTRRRSSSTGSSLSALSHRLSGGFNPFGRNGASTRTSGTPEPGWNDDPLALGKDSQAAGAPEQWVVIMGPRGSGKSTLVRQLKLAHDGLDVTDATRFVREVHKYAQGLVKQVISDAIQQLRNHHMKSTAERVLALPRRALLTSADASDILALWQLAEVRDSEEKLVDVLSRRACRYFVQRIEVLTEQDYVPDSLDVMYLALPTVGQQETRITSFAGGPLSIFETNLDPNRSSTLSRGGRGNDLFGSGLRGVVFVASLLDHEPGTSASDIRPSQGALKLWNKARACAAAQSVPCYLLLSKRDLLWEACAMPSSNMNALTVETSLHAHFLNQGTSSSSALEASNVSRRLASAPKEQMQPLSSNEQTLKLDILDSESGATPFIELMMKHSFPELELDENAMDALGNAVHVCLGYFCDAERSILSRHGSLPSARWQGQPLLLSNHTWLHDLPDPIPNPRHVSAELALRLGKDSADTTQANFWAAINALSDQLGSFEPTYLGRLHTSPLLTKSGALLVVFRQDFDSLPSLGSNRSRGLKWRPVSTVAARLANVAQAIEFNGYRKGTQVSSYTSDVKLMLTEHATHELQPSMWLERIRTCIQPDVPRMHSGTYVAAFYTLSVNDGFRILVSEQDHMSMPPLVKISDNHLTVSEWDQIRALGESTQEGKLSSHISSDWAAAMGWLGPDVSSEKQFSVLQKFFYGVIHLRQRLEQRCDATHDELRYSRVEGAMETLEALGEVYTQEIVVADESARIQLVVVINHHDASRTESKPKGFRWAPFQLFEAQHLKNFSASVHERVNVGKQIIARGRAAADQITMCKRRSTLLRGSGALSMHGSGIRDSTDTPFSLSGMLCLHDVEGKSSVDAEISTGFKGVALLGADDESSLEDAWGPLRWTKRAVHFMTRRLHAKSLALLRTSNQGETMCIDMAKFDPEDRKIQHMEMIRRCSEALDQVNTSLMDKLTTLEERLKQGEGEATATKGTWS